MGRKGVGHWSIEVAGLGKKGHDSGIICCIRRYEERRGEGAC